MAADRVDRLLQILSVAHLLAPGLGTLQEDMIVAAAAPRILLTNRTGNLLYVWIKPQGVGAPGQVAFFSPGVTGIFTRADNVMVESFECVLKPGQSLAGTAAVVNTVITVITLEINADLITQYAR